MDETVKPLRIPPQMSVYADKHAIFHLVQSMVSSLVIDQPDDPIPYLIGLLQRSSVDIPRIMLLGPPAVGKHTVAKKLSAELRAVHVTTDTLLQDQSELSIQAQQHTLTQQELPAELLIRLIEQRLTEVDCFNRKRRVNKVNFYGNNNMKQVTVYYLDNLSVAVRFHAVTRPAPSLQVQNRLETQPEDDTHAVTHTLDQYRTHTAVLQVM
ncbi:adenylate kinase 8-like [Seriola lalandi dorsalis]|uniref:adenylate kinase 8-like n=1 Tax=Seriola lalandi dorsalis TaxID=1841481 RepID=UPI000C6F7BA5|nr:adenylate kinase 8-like [Seriola lalandi dorsalis]